jgi:hypothetical protein
VLLGHEDPADDQVAITAATGAAVDPRPVFIDTCAQTGVTRASTPISDLRPAGALKTVSGTITMEGCGTGAPVVHTAAGSVALPCSTFRRLADDSAPTLVASADLVGAGCWMWISNTVFTCPEQR